MIDENYIPHMRRLDYELEALAHQGDLAIAFSGGIDSTFLLHYAHSLLGNKVKAFTASSAFFPESELAFSKEFCAENGIELHIEKIDILADPVIASNPKDRCYHCKRAIFERITDAAKLCGCAHVVDGTNVDDMDDYRPGLKALEELGVESPLKRAGLTKDDIRALSCAMGIEIWDKPAFACLATRFPYDTALVRDQLIAVEHAEQVLHDLGFVQCRVRVHGSDLDVARIEVEPERIADVMGEDVRRSIDSGLKALGFGRVSVDLAGYGR